MTVNVGKALLQDAEQDKFSIARRAVHMLGDVAFDVKAAAPGESFDEPARGGGDSGFIEQWRMQEIGSSTYFLQRLIGQCVEIVDQGVESGRRSFYLPDQSDGHLHRSEGLAHGVVKVACDATAFLVLQGHQSGRELPEIALGLLADADLGLQTVESPREFLGTLQHPRL